MRKNLKGTWSALGNNRFPLTSDIIKSLFHKTYSGYNVHDRLQWGNNFGPKGRFYLYTAISQIKNVGERF